MKLLLVCLLAGVLCADAVPIKSAPMPSTTQVPIPLSQTKVEAYVKNLRQDLEAQERDLGDFLKKALMTKTRKESRLRTLVPILDHLSEQLKNTTKYYGVYNRYVDDEKRVLRPFTIEYDRALGLYNSTSSKLTEERLFLDTLAKYITASKQFRTACIR
jgi:hypothetical protein